MFTDAKATPTSPKPEPTPSNSAKADNEWDMVTPEEATGYYTDRITLLLGPSNTTYLILIPSIPKTSVLLTSLANYEASQRYMHLPALTPNMLTLYLSQPCNKPLVMASWLDIIKLAITAELLEDTTVESIALAALKQKDGPLFDHHDFAFARAYQNSTGSGDTLMQTLTSIANQSPSAQVPAPRLRESKHVGKFGKSVLKSKMSSVARKDGDGVRASRQPRVPPSVEALRGGTERNFLWPWGEKSEAGGSGMKIGC
jgi:hypothetical protein